MSPEQMRKAASVLEREADALWQGHSLNGGWVLLDDADIAARADHNEMTDLARLLREQADAMRFRVLLQADAYCPGCGHNRDKSSVSTVKREDGMHECQMCGAAWSEIPPPPQGREG